MDAADIFEMFAHSGFSFAFGGGPRKRKGKDSVIPYDVTLEDLYNGKQVKMNMEKDIICSTCNGSGAKGNAKPKTCIKCDGNGSIITTTPLGNSMFGQGRSTCPDCKGSGEKLREKDHCKKCKGKKVVSEKKRLEISIEKGMVNGQRIVLYGEGDQSPGIPAGDVVFVLQLQRHDAFERSGNDIIAKVQITLSESLLGFSRILIKHLDGRGLKVSSPRNKIIKTSDTIVLKGEGMPHFHRSGEKGDLYIVFTVEFPSEEWLSTVDRKELEKHLPPKKPELDPQPDKVDEVKYEEGDFVDVRARSFPAGAEFMDQNFTSQFGEGDDNDWTDDDEEEDGPDCPQQ